MISSPRIDVATADDIEVLAKLRVEQGWQRSELLLGAIMAWEHGRIFVVREASLAPEAEDGQAPIAAVSAIAAPPIGVIGNVVVRADYRRRGLAKLLMRATLDWLRENGVRSVLLDATEEGRPLYTSFGFVPRELSYYAHAPVAALDASRLRQLAAGLHAHAHLASIDELARIAELDRQAFGDRLGLLALILRAPHTWLYIAEDAAGQTSGYVLVRRLEFPYVGIRLGPFVATSPAVAAALLEAVLAEDAWRTGFDANDTGSGAPHMYISISGASTQSLRFFEEIGARIELDDLIMELRLADDGTPGTPDSGTAHPEWLYGWLAPMVF